MKFNKQNIENKTKLCDESLPSAQSNYSGPVLRSTSGEPVSHNNDN